jgi:hypothetical protein
MCHPLYPVACRIVGRHVNVHHMSGRTYTGLLQSVTPSGVYVMPHSGPMRYACATELTPDITHSIHGEDGDEGNQLVYAPAAFFGFGALAGFTLGAIAARSLYW